MRALRLNALGAPTYIRDLPLASSKRVAAPDTGGHFRGVTAAAALTLSGHSVLPVRARQISQDVAVSIYLDSPLLPGKIIVSSTGSDVAPRRRLLYYG
jgi:hypothetical protein